MTSTGDGDVVTQVISQQTMEDEAVAVRRNSPLDQAIRQLQERQNGENQQPASAVHDFVSPEMPRRGK